MSQIPCFYFISVGDFLFLISPPTLRWMNADKKSIRVLLLICWDFRPDEEKWKVFPPANLTGERESKAHVLSKDGNDLGGL